MTAKPAPPQSPALREALIDLLWEQMTFGIRQTKEDRKFYGEAVDALCAALAAPSPGLREAIEEIVESISPLRADDLGQARKRLVAALAGEAKPACQFHGMALPCPVCEHFAQSPVLPPAGVEGTWRQSDEAIRSLIAEEIWRYQECVDSYGPFNGVSVDGGDLKALAKQMAIDEAEGIRKVILESSVLRARLSALSASVAGEADHCKKCGCELNGEAALVGDEVWCHPCADAAPSPALDHSALQERACK